MQRINADEGAFNFPAGINPRIPLEDMLF